MFVLRRHAENLSNTMFSKAYIIQILSLVQHETGSTVIVRTALWDFLNLSFQAYLSCIKLLCRSQ